MIDIHCHILPGIDDGPKSVDESLAMLRMAAEDGIQQVVATPHWGGPYYKHAPDLIRHVVERLNQRAQADGLSIEVLPGCEAHLELDLADLVQAGEVLTLGDLGKYVLIEVPGLPIPLYALDTHFALRLAGFTPILAHAERLAISTSAWQFIRDFAYQGGLIQVNAESIGGQAGRQIQNTCKKLLRERLLHVIASDGHSPDHRLPLLTPCLRGFSRREREKVLQRFCELDLSSAD